MKVLVTGGGGFVGRRVVDELLRRGHQVVAPMRRPIAIKTAEPQAILEAETPKIGDLGMDADWSQALTGCAAVIHCAARAHVLNDDCGDPLAEFRRVNRDGTIRLAQQAQEAGIAHFIFISTIKVNGETTPLDRPFRADDPPAPADAYGIAKAEAEIALTALTGMDVTILRPPLVHGPGVKGNLAVLCKAVAQGLPLPLACLRNRRSLVGVDNLADAIGFLLDRRATGTFLIRDDIDLSTADLIRELAQAMGRPAHLWPVPPSWLAAAARLLGRRASAQRVLGSLVVDDSPLRALGWSPPLSLNQGFARMIKENA